MTDRPQNNKNLLNTPVVRIGNRPQNELVTHRKRLLLNDVIKSKTDKEGKHRERQTDRWRKKSKRKWGPNVLLSITMTGER